MQTVSVTTIRATEVGFLNAEPSSPILRIEGDIQEWRSVGDLADHLRQISALTIGVCNGDPAGDVPRGLLACDLRVLLGANGGADWNTVVATNDDLDRWVLAIVDAVTATPLAAAAATRVVRLAPRLEASDALVVESFAYSMLQAGPEYQEWSRRRVA